MKFITDLNKGILGQADSTELWEDIISHIPDDILLKPDVKILSVACGHCTEAILIAKRMMALGISKEVVQDSIYLIDKYQVFTNPAKSVYGFKHVITEDFLTWNVNLKFDVVIGNPPFQQSASGKKRDSAANIWPRIVARGATLTKSGGYFAFVTPNGWITPSADVGKGKTGIRIYDIMSKYHTMHLNINECAKYFPGVGSSFTYFVINKIKNNKKLTTIVSDNGTCNANLLNVQYMPTIVSKLTVSLNSKILQGTPLGFSNNNTSVGMAFGQDIVDKKDSNHPVKCFHSSADNGTYKYSSHNSAEVQRTKVMVCSSGNFVPVYDLGTIGLTTKIYVYYLSPNETLSAVKSYIESKLVTVILNQNKTSGWVSYAFRLLPKVDLTHSWTDEELYKHFNLTQEEIDYVEANVK